MYRRPVFKQHYLGVTVDVLRLKVAGVTIYTLLRLQTTGVTIALNRLFVTGIRMSRVTYCVQTALAEAADTGNVCCCQHSALVQASGASGCCYSILIVHARA